MTRLKAAALGLGVIFAGAYGLAALAQAPAAPAGNDYSKAENWLCWPGKEMACATTQNATSVAPDGSLKPVAFARPARPAYDCFYVYPTASEDPTPNSDMVPGREIGVAVAQFGRYGAVCRQFAPMYRSVSLGALRANMAGTPQPVVPNLNYNDVKDAWDHYLKTENKGRGVILVGHSQGAGLLARLIAAEIEGKPVQKQIIAAHLLGTTVLVPPGKDVGGTFKSMPLCRKAGQTGCIVVYGSYRSTLPPSVTPPARFGRGRDGQVASCTNPAALGGGKATLDTYQTTGTTAWAKGATFNTPYVRLPGLVTGECVTSGDFTYLKVTVNADPADPRADNIAGDVGSPPDPTWGLHNGDMSVAMGDLVKLAGVQGQAWLKAKR